MDDPFNLSAMKKSVIVTILLTFMGLYVTTTIFAKGPLDPVKVDTWTLSVGCGPGTHPFGNGIGFGPAEKVVFEAGLWDVGPGVITLGGETAFSFYSHNFNNDWKERWANFFLGARGAYHYGWDIKGLDTYAGLPLGIGFTYYTYDDHPGKHGSTPVYPYLGIFFGGSYYFDKYFGINGEVGFNATYANIGVIFRID